MISTVNNDFLKVTVEHLGSELISVKDLKTNQEYIWQKNKKFWNKSSPILFPFVGALKNDSYIYKEKTYHFPFRHGFARDYEHKVIKKEDNMVEFLFTHTDETLKIYPFKFNLYIKYTLENRTLNIEYKVENLSNEDMYFSLGAHPAFSTPFENVQDFSNYFIEFENKETGISKVLNGSLIDHKNEKNVFNGKVLELNKDTFINDALIFENTNSNTVYLKNKTNNKNIKFKYDGFKYIAFWNVPGASYVCFEPWNGIADYDNSTGNLTEKIGIEKLSPNSSYERKIEITFN